MNPGVRTVMTNKAVALARLGRYEQAEMEFREALDLDPRDMTAWTNLGLCLSRSGTSRKRLPALKKSVNLRVSGPCGISCGDTLHFVMQSFTGFLFSRLNITKI